MEIDPIDKTTAAVQRRRAQKEVLQYRLTSKSSARPGDKGQKVRRWLRANPAKEEWPTFGPHTSCKWFQLETTRDADSLYKRGFSSP